MKSLLLFLPLLLQIPNPNPEPWITPRYGIDHAAKTQFSNDPTFSTFVEGRFNGMLPNGDYVGPYDGQTSIYKYARTTESRRIKWRYVPLYYYDYNTATKTRTLKLGGYDRRYPDTKTQIEVQQYFDEQFQEQKKRYEERIIAEDYKRQQDGLKRRKADLEQQLQQIESQLK